MDVNYENNDGVITKIVTNEEIIDLQQLEDEIANLEEQILNMPSIKTEPDQETLEFWNMENHMLIDKEILQSQIDKKIELLNTLRNI